LPAVLDIAAQIADALGAVVVDVVVRGRKGDPVTGLACGARLGPGSAARATAGGTV
jgi:hypothetical protein